MAMAYKDAEPWIRTAVTIGSILVALGMGWQALSSRVAAIEASDAKQALSIEALREDRQDDRNAITGMQTDLRYIRESLQRLEGRLNPPAESRPRQ